MLWRGMILRDPVHGLVSFEAPEQAIIERLLEAPEVQRLRKIRQLGLTSLAYPGADHTRFSHALGTAHVMSRFLERMRAVERQSGRSPTLGEAESCQALAAALLHDVGHGPFSHLFEVVAPEGIRHEDWSERIILDPSTQVHAILSSVTPDLPARVAELIRGTHELPYLARAVSGAFDVDRCDYLLRDAHFTGVSYGKFDLDWLLRSFCLVPTDSGLPALAIDGQKGLPAIESFILARLFMFQQVYFHKASRASEWLLGRVFARLSFLVRAQIDVPGLPRGLREVLLTGTTSLEHYLDLDDPTMWTLLRAFNSHKDPILRDLSTRIYHRKLFKSYDLFGEDATSMGRERALMLVREIAHERGLDPDFYVGIDVPSVVAFDDSKDPITVLFPDGTSRRPAEVSFLLGRLRDETLMRPRVIFAAELRPDVVRALGQISAHHESFAGGTFETRADLHANSNVDRGRS